MPSSNSSSSSATVVEIAGFRTIDKPSSLNLAPRRPSVKKVLNQQFGAELLSVRQHLSYQASVEIDQLDRIDAEHGRAVSTALAKRVRVLLDKEFGKLRVHKSRHVFLVRHRSVEGIISSLLRLQFLARELELPENNKMGKPSGVQSVSLTWGVGRTSLEAEGERLRRRKQKKRR